MAGALDGEASAMAGADMGVGGIGRVIGLCLVFHAPMAPRRSLALPLGLALPLTLSLAAAAQELRGRVVGITGGDTLTLLTDARQEVRVRLADVGTPERGQPYGDQARQALSDLAFDKRATPAGPWRGGGCP